MKQKMTKRRIFSLLLIGLSSYLFFLVALFPVELFLTKVRSLMPASVQLEQATGTILRGKARLIYKDEPATLNWRLCPFVILKGICIDAEFAGIKVMGALGREDTALARNLSLEFSVDSLSRAGFQIGSLDVLERSDFILFFDEIHFTDDGRLASWTGNGKIEELKLIPLSEQMTGDLAFEEQEVRLMLVGASTTINGNIEKINEKTLSIKVNVSTDLSDLEMLLRSVCQVDASNRYKCEFQVPYRS